MSQKYLNDGVQFACQYGATPLSPKDLSNINVKIRDKVALTTNTKLLGSFGTCTIKQGAPCTPALSAWLKTSQNVSVGSAKLLTADSYCMCMAGGGKVSLSPLSRPNVMAINVDDSASAVQVNIQTDSSTTKTTTTNNSTTSSSNGATPKGMESTTPNRPTGSKTIDTKTATVVGTSATVNDSTSTSHTNDDSTQAKGVQSQPLESFSLVCKCHGDRTKCPKEYQESCPYANTSSTELSSNLKVDGQNAKVLKENLMERYKDTKCIACTYRSFCWNGSTIEFDIPNDKKVELQPTFHHLIPVRSAFSLNPTLVRIANYLEFDINNANNGICLLTLTHREDISQRDPSTLIRAFKIMDYHKVLLHRTSHEYQLSSELQTLKSSCKGLAMHRDAVRFNGANYNKTVCNDLSKVEAILKQKYGNRCLMQVDKATLYKDFMYYIDSLDRTIYNRLDSFKVHPLNVAPYFISAEVIRYAYTYDKRKSGGELF